MPKDKEDKIYHYSVGYGSYEEAPEIVLSSNKLYSKESFYDLCAKATRDLYDNKKTNFLNKKFFYSQARNQRFRMQFDEIYKEVALELCKTHNFKIIEPRVRFMPFGWADILNIDDWEGDIIDNLEEPINMIRSKIFGRRHLLIEKVPVFIDDDDDDEDIL